MTENEIRISEAIQSTTVDLNLQGITKKEEAIDYLSDLLFKAEIISSKEDFTKSVYERESLGPTFMENSIAIPHGKSSSVKRAAVAFGRSKDGFMYDTQWGGGVAKLIFLLAIPDDMDGKLYIKVLSRLARLLVHENFRNQLMAVTSYQEFIAAVNNGEKLLDGSN